MNKKHTTAVGLGLIGLGIIILLLSVVAPMTGALLWHLGIWKLWPLIVIGLGTILSMMPLLKSGSRGLGSLFIPGITILSCGFILLFTSFFNIWQAWSWLWPLQILGLALGFLFAAIRMRALWLLVPTIILGFNGALLQFCAITGWWEIWAVLWTIEPLSIGLGLLLIGLLKQRSGLLTASLIICGISVIALLGMSSILSLTNAIPGIWLLNILLPVAIIGAGALLLLYSVVKAPTADARPKSRAPKAATPVEG